MSNREDSGHPMRLVGQINRAFARLVDSPLRDIGFAMSQLPVLVELKTRGALSQAELTRLARVEQSSMAQLLNRMERDDLVQRVPDLSDKRSRLITLTAGASQRLAKGKAVMEATSQQALAGFSKAERDQLAGLLQRVKSNLDRAAGETD